MFTCLCIVVGPWLMSTSPACEKRYRHSSGSASPAYQKSVNRAPLLGTGGVATISTVIYQNRCNSYTACRLCRFEPLEYHNHRVPYQSNICGHVDNTPQTSLCLVTQKSFVGVVGLLLLRYVKQVCVVYLPSTNPDMNITRYSRSPFHMKCQKNVNCFLKISFTIVLPYCTLLRSSSFLVLSFHEMRNICL